MKPSNVAHLPTPQEMEQAQESSRTLSKYASAERVHVTVRGSNKESDELILPGHVLQILLDVIAYKDSIDQKRGQSLDELTALSQQDDMGY